MNSKIILCSGIKLERDYKNVLTYSESDMLSLCNSKAKATKTTYSFIKHGKNTVEVDIDFATCLKCNYMAFQNTDYGNKWFFAFIDSCEYRNNYTTRINFTVDVFHTWYDYWTPSACYVLREHTNDDTIGNNTIPEGLETGEMVINSCGEITTKLNSTYTCIGCSWVPNNTPFYTNNRVFGGVFSGMNYILFRTIDSAAKFVQAIDDLGRDSSTTINCIFEIPEALTGIPIDDPSWTTGNLGNQTDIGFHLLSNVLTSTLEDNIQLTMNNTLNGYTPKNNKLFTSEFNKLIITNNAGQQVEYNYEDFINNIPVVSLVGTVTPSCSIMMIPKNYKKNDTSKSGYNWGLSVAKFPMGSWNSDLYTNWMTAAGVNVLGHQIDAPTLMGIKGTIQLITGGIGISRGAKASKLTGGEEGGDMMSSGASSIGGGIATMFDAVQQMRQHALTPNAINGQTNSGDMTFAYRKMSPTYYNMCVRYEFASLIDDWFTRFGYKTNKIKLPNQLGRTYWNYVQIGMTENIGYSNSTASVPQDAMELINNIYRNGVTLWHSHDNLGNYSLNNTIVSQ